jgi:uncharacterized membrane protein YgaE (UPF0421/DUF939 family)
MSEPPSPEPPPLTSAVPVGSRTGLRMREGLDRIRGSALAIVQLVVAATAAYAFAYFVLGHPAPLLAATVTVSSLGLVRDARPIRVLETVVGMLVGILIAELLLLVAGAGWWQLGLALAVTLVVARFLSAQPAFAIAAAIQALIVMAIPGAAPFQRLVDGVVGGIAALLVTALIPRTTRSVEGADAHALFDAFDAAATSLVTALRHGDRARADRGLERARALQGAVERWRGALESGREIARISPFLHRQRSEIARHERVLAAMDLAVRNLRVVGRRVAYVTDDGAARPEAAEVLAELQRAAALIGDALDDISLEPVARASLVAVARRLDPAAMLPHASLGEQNLLAAMRPLAVDLLVATGMPAAEARAVVPRI